MYIHTSACLLVRLDVHPMSVLILLSVHPSIRLCISVFLFAYPSLIWPSLYLSFHLSLISSVFPYLHICLTFCNSTFPSFCQSILLPVPSSVRPLLCLSFHMFCPSLSHQLFTPSHDSIISIYFTGSTSVAAVKCRTTTQ